MGLFGNSKGPKKYSKEWLSSLTLEELYEEREPVRKAYCSGDSKAEGILNLFGNEEIKRMNENYINEHPDTKPRPPREHGWYLPNDD